MKIVDGNLDNARRCAAYISKKYHDAGYVVRQVPEYGTYVIIIRSQTTGFWGGIKKYCACTKDVTLRVGIKGSRLSVDASGDYTRQIGTGGFGMFIAVGALAITATAGAIGQHTLVNQVEADAVRFLEHDSSPALSLMA